MCVAQLEEVWYRAQIVATYPEDDTCEVQFLDFGGFCKVNNSSLRQIHFNYVSLPFQAAECYLANIRLKPGKCLIYGNSIIINIRIPTENNSNTCLYLFSDIDILEGVDYVDRVTQHCLLQTNVVGYNAENVPLVYVYFINAHNVSIYINKHTSYAKSRMV